MKNKNPKITRGFRIREGILARLKKAAEREGMTVSTLADKAIEAGLPLVLKEKNNG